MEFDPFAYHCAICLFREHPSETLSDMVIAAVIARGRPIPALPLLSKECRYKGKVFTRRFKKDNYLRYDWLTGCDVENKLFCWPCYIFCSDPTDTWGYKGFDGLSNFSNSVKTHINQDVHLVNTEKYNYYADDDKKISLERSLVQHCNSNPGRRKTEEILPVTSVQLPEEVDESEIGVLQQLDVSVELHDNKKGEVSCNASMFRRRLLDWEDYMLFNSSF